MILGVAGCGQGNPPLKVRNPAANELSLELDEKEINLVQGSRTPISLKVDRNFDDPVKIKFAMPRDDISIKGTQLLGKGTKEVTYQVSALPDAELSSEPLKVVVTGLGGSKEDSKIFYVKLRESQENKLARRDSYVKKVQEEVDQLRSNLDGMRKNLPEDLSEEKIGEYLKDLGNSYVELNGIRNRINSVAKATAEEWEEIKTDLNAALSRLKTAKDEIQISQQ